MTRAIVIFFILTPFYAFAQVRLQKLVVKPNETFVLAPSDIIVCDTLLMMDSSRIRLNELKPASYIRARVAIFGNQCVIDGKGVNGKNGINGPKGKGSTGPCQQGGAGRNGGRGLNGTPGLALFLYIDSVRSIGSLVIDLSGGNGGDGGNGGAGGGGTPGTMHCRGGDGGDGGNGGAGGNGGPGGTLTLGGKSVDYLRAAIGKDLTVFNKGGSFGYGGVPGYGGPAGLAPDRNNGKAGGQGIDGKDGHAAANGTIRFEY